MASFEIEPMVRGYRIYKDMWSAVIDEEFPCKREDGNRFAVSVCLFVSPHLSHVQIHQSSSHAEYSKIYTQHTLTHTVKIGASSCVLLLTLNKVKSR